MWHRVEKATKAKSIPTTRLKVIIIIIIIIIGHAWFWTFGKFAQSVRSCFSVSLYTFGHEAMGKIFMNLDAEEFNKPLGYNMNFIKILQK
jgi:hypothetical protein